MITIADTTTVLARAAIFDQRLSRPSHTVIGGWSDEFNKHDLQLHDLLGGVSAYYEIGRDRVIQVGDVIRAARDLRQRRAQIENGHAARQLPPGQPPRLEPGNALNADGAPVRAAYEVNDAIEQPCEHCNAEYGQWCENPTTGNPTKIPHLTRLKAAHINAGRPKGRQL